MTLIYAVADIHSRPDRFAFIRTNILRHRPDVVVAAGDISRLLVPASTFAQLSRLPAPVLAVRGNTDLPLAEKVMARSRNIASLHLRRVDHGDAVFFGVGGTIPLPFHSKLRLAEQPLLQAVGRSMPPGAVFVCHPPPHGTLDGVFGNRAHAGSRCVARIVHRCRPAVVVCGHIHESRGIERLADTLVVNCSIGIEGQGAMIRMFPGHRPPEADLLP